MSYYSHNETSLPMSTFAIWCRFVQSRDDRSRVFSRPLVGCTKQTFLKHQRVHNCSVRVIFDGNSQLHVTPLLCDHLHWLRERERISFKLCLLGYKAIHGLSTCYLNEICIPLSAVPNLFALVSAACGDFVVPRTRLQLGNRAFCVAGPVAWNSLPLDIRSAPTLSTFKSMFKTHLAYFHSACTETFI